MEIRELYETYKDINARVSYDVDWRIAMLAVVTELAECVNEGPWRPWRNTDRRPLNEADRSRMLHEWADMVSTALRTGTYIGFTAEEVESALAEHIEVKYERIESGQDGQRPECICREINSRNCPAHPYH